MGDPESPLLLPYHPKLQRCQDSQHPILWVGLSISTTYYPKLIVRFKDKVGLDYVTNIMQYYVCTSLQHPWLNNDSNIDLRTEKSCHETNSLKVTSFQTIEYIYI